MGFSWQLINDSITDSDKKALTDFINIPNQRFTQGEKVREFEDAWSKYLGCEYSNEEIINYLETIKAPFQEFEDEILFKNPFKWKFLTNIQVD